MEALTPLAAFQALCIAAAGGVVFEFRKEPRPWRYVGFAAAAALALFGVFATWIGSTWPKMLPVMYGLGSSPVTWFVVLWSIYVLARPYWKRGAEPNLSTDVPALQPYDDTNMRKDIDRLSETVRAVVQDYQRMSGLEARFGDRLDKLKDAIDASDKHASDRFAIIERQLGMLTPLPPKVEEIRVDLAITRMEAEKAETIRKKEADQFRGSFLALRSRETLSALEIEMERDASDLYDRLKAGEAYDKIKWAQWENVHGHWEGLLNQWLSTATWYAKKVKSRTLTIDEDLYSAEWTIPEDQFPNAEAVRRFKKFRIIYSQWHDVVSDVHNGMETVAFVGLTDQEVRGGEAAG